MGQDSRGCGRSRGRSSVGRLLLNVRHSRRSPTRRWRCSKGLLPGQVLRARNSAMGGLRRVCRVCVCRRGRESWWGLGGMKLWVALCMRTGELRAHRAVVWRSRRRRERGVVEGSVTGSASGCLGRLVVPVITSIHGLGRVRWERTSALRTRGVVVRCRLRPRPRNRRRRLRPRLGIGQRRALSIVGGLCIEVGRQHVHRLRRRGGRATCGHGRLCVKRHRLSFKAMCRGGEAG